MWNDVRIPDQHVLAPGYAFGNAQLNAEAYGPARDEAEELPPTSLNMLAKPRRQLKSSSVTGCGKRKRSKEMRRKPLGIMTPISESAEYDYCDT